MCKYSSFEIHLKRLDDMKKDLEIKKKKKLQLIDQKQDELLLRTNNNKRHAQQFKDYQRMLEVQRNNEALLRRIEDISQRSNTQQIKTLLNQRSHSIEILEQNLSHLDNTKSLIKDRSKLSISILQPKTKRFSLIESKKKKEEKQIHDENKKMMLRIINKVPSVSLRKQEQDYKKHLAAKKVLSQYHEDYFPVEKLYQKRKQSMSRLPPLIADSKRSVQYGDNSQIEQYDQNEYNTINTTNVVLQQHSLSMNAGYNNDKSLFASIGNNNINGISRNSNSPQNYLNSLPHPIIVIREANSRNSYKSNYHSQQRTPKVQQADFNDNDELEQIVGNSNGNIKMTEQSINQDLTSRKKIGLSRNLIDQLNNNQAQTLPSTLSNVNSNLKNVHLNKSNNNNIRSQTQLSNNTSNHIPSQSPTIILANLQNNDTTISIASDSNTQLQQTANIQTFNKDDNIIQNQDAIDFPQLLQDDSKNTDNEINQNTTSKDVDALNQQQPLSSGIQTPKLELINDNIQTPQTPQTPKYKIIKCVTIGEQQSSNDQGTASQQQKIQKDAGNNSLIKEKYPLSPDGTNHTQNEYDFYELPVDLQQSDIKLIETTPQSKSLNKNMIGNLNQSLDKQNEISQNYDITVINNNIKDSNITNTQQSDKKSSGIGIGSGLMGLISRNIQQKLEADKQQTTTTKVEQPTLQSNEHQSTQNVETQQQQQQQKELQQQQVVNKVSNDNHKLQQQFQLIVNRDSKVWEEEDIYCDDFS